MNQIEKILKETEAFRTEKGFIIIPIKSDLMRKISELPYMPICDSCIKSGEETGMYIPVLNQWFCIDCYDEWYQKARYYEDDRKFEEDKFLEMVELIKENQDELSTR